MVKKIAILGFSTCLFCLGVARSAEQTTPETNWHDQTFTEVPLHKVLVVGLTQDEELRRTLENELSRILADRGVTAKASAEIIPAKEGLGKEVVLKALSKKDFDAILVSQLVDIDMGISSGYKEEKEGANSNPHASFDDSYPHAYTITSAPEYLAGSNAVSIETKLYSAKTHKLIWSGTSDIFNRSAHAGLIKSMESVIVKDFSENGFINRPT